MKFNFYFNYIPFFKKLRIIMKFTILTIFPEAFSYLNQSIIWKAQEKNLIEIEIIDIREFSKDKHKKVDDAPYWWEQWMVMTCQPIFDAIEHIKEKSKYKNIYTIFVSPRWENLKQEKLKKLSEKENHEIIILCWRYEWIDQRVIDTLVDEEICIWEYILTWGEIPAMILVDWISRLIPWVIWKEESHLEESFSKALDWKKEFPYYTRPENFRWMKVPEVLLSGHHKNIEKWKKENLK